MSNTASLKNRGHLPLRAIYAAEVLNDFEKGATKEEFKERLRDHKSLEPSNAEKLIRMLRMTENVEIEEDKAKLLNHVYECQGFKENPLRRQEMEARKAHSKTLADLKDD